MSFPKIHNGAKPIIKDDTLTFTYIDSYGDIITETKNILSPDQIKQRVMDRLSRFKNAGPGSRESELSRAERKYVSAHSEKILKQAWSKLDEHGQMEMSMMLDMSSHFGISDPKWAENHAGEREEIIGDNMSPL